MTNKTLFQLTAFDGEKKIGQFVLCRKHSASTKNSYSQDRPHNITVFIDKLVDNPNDYTEGDYCESCELFKETQEDDDE